MSLLEIENKLNKLISEHPYLVGDAIVSAGRFDLGKLLLVVGLRDRKLEEVWITDFDLIEKIILSNRTKSIVSALTVEIPTVDMFINFGGKRSIDQTPYYKVTFSGDTGEVWTIGGRFRGRADPDDSRRIQWIQWEDLNN